MKKQLTILSALAIMALSSLYFIGCTQQETVATGNVASGLMANSLSSTSVGLHWTRDVNDAGTDRVIVMDGSTVVDSSVTASNPGASATINGLQAGKMYTFYIRNDAGPSASINWMTATRTNNLKIYEYAAPSSLGFSGLDLNGAAGQAQVLSMTGSNLSTTVDFVLFSNAANDSLFFESADAFDANYRVAQGSDLAFYAVGGLDMHYLPQDLSKYTYENGGWSTASPTSDATDYRTNGSKIKLVKTADGNYARIEFVPDATTGKLYSTSGGYKYVTVNVSYQPSASMPYAARPQPNRPPAGYGNPRHVTQ